MARGEEPWAVRCKVTKSARGEPVKPHWAMRGQQVCYAHGGAAKQNRAAGKRRIEHKAAMTALDKYRAIAGGEEDIEPAELLIRLVKAAWFNVCFLEAQVRNLNQGKTQVNKDTKEVAEGLWTFIPEVGYVPTPWKKMYDEERDRAAKYAMDAVRAGVSEKLVEIRKQEADILFHLQEVGWQAAQLTQDQRTAAMKAIQKEILRKGLIQGQVA